MRAAALRLGCCAVVLGIVVATGFEPSYNAAGFSAALGATGARALKAVVQVCRSLQQPV